ncbi:glycosyltransferase [Amycolatopsis jejuensis]|uniref:glycosyltransferase n=1 Tax=Amycolatopsis jejuensis TaxID=330084 RepID=UPI0006896755|nr:glycosyltransferase [Amycolatopsis jejuensis]
MRVLFSAIGAYGHIFPMIPFARALVAQGHEILFATSADFGPVLSRAGLRHISVAKPLNATRTTAYGTRIDGDDLTPEQALWLFGRVFGSDAARDIHAELGPVIQDFAPGLVIHDAFNPGGALAARAAGVPALCHGFGRATTGRVASTTEYHVRALAGELGIALPDDYPATVGNPMLDIFPPSLQHSKLLTGGNRIALRPVAYSEPAELPELPAGRPLVYVTLGTVFGKAGTLRTIVDGLTSAGLPVLVATGPTVETDELPASVSVHRWVPQALLLPHVDLAVHHGGSGTVLGALSAGVQQLLVPQGADQLTNGRALDKAGVAPQLLPEQVTADALAELATRILADGSYRTRIGEIQAEISGMPSPEEVAAQLPDLVERAEAAMEAGAQSLS